MHTWHLLRPSKVISVLACIFCNLQAPVPVAIGGPGLPDSVKFRDDLPNAGLANITGTYLNLLGFATPSHMVESLL